MLTINGEFGADRATSCLNQSESPELPLAHLVFIPGEQSQPLYQEWLLWLSKRGVHVQILIEDFDHNPGLGKAANDLIVQIKPKIDHKEPSSWTHHLFGTSTAEVFPEISIQTSPDSLIECENVLRQCHKKNSEGVNWQKICIFVRDPNTYAPLLLSTAKRFGIKVSINVGLPLLSNGLASICLKLVTALASSDPRELIPLLHSTYFNLDNEKVDQLTQLLKESSISPDPFLHLSNELKEIEGLAKFSEIIEWRQLHFSEPTSIANWGTRFFELIQNSGFLDSVTQSLVTRERDLRAQTLIQRSVHEASLRLQSQTLELEEFAKRLREQWSLERVAWNSSGNRATDTIPDAIRICTATSQLQDFDSVFVLGMLEGTMPRRRTEDPVLNDDDRETINQINPDLPPLQSSHIKAAAERDEFIRICGSASKSLIFTYPEISETRDNIPAFYLQELRRAIPSIEPTIRHSNEVVPPLEDCVLYADLVLRKSLEKPADKLKPIQLTSPIAQKIAQPDPETPLDPAQIGMAAECPFKSAFKYQFKLYSNYNRTFSTILKSTPNKAKLAELPNRETATDALNVQVKQEIEWHSLRLKHWEVEFLKQVSDSLIPAWVAREFDFREQYLTAPYQTEFPGYVGGNPNGWEWKIEGKPYLFSSRFHAIIRTPNETIGLFYNSNTPEFSKNNSENDSLAKSIEVSLNLVGLMSEGKKNVRVVIDGFKERKSYSVQQQKRIRFAKLENITSVGLTNSVELEPGESPPPNELTKSEVTAEFCRDLKAKIAKPLQDIFTGNITPIPGNYCRKCRFAELCRSHSEFGDSSTKPSRGEI